MRQVLVRYQVKPEAAAENEALVRQVYEDLQRTTPPGIQYATFVLEDGVSFVHLAQTAAVDGRSPLFDVPAFQRFQQGIAERCAVQPLSTPLREVGSFRFWAE